MTLDELPAWLLLIAYASLVVELTFVAVPSEASTLQLFTKEAGTDGGGRLAGARSRSFLGKVVCYFLPTALGVVMFVAPLAVACWPPLTEWALPIVDTRGDGPIGPVLIWTGLALVFAGRILTTVAALQLRRRHHRGDHALQPGGLFAVSRNPILLGMYLFYLGNCVWLPSPMLWAGFVPYAWNMHRRVLIEEDFLRTRLGHRYVDYLASAPRYVGRPRKTAGSR